MRRTALAQRLWIAALACCCLAWVPGCGYQFVGAATLDGAHYDVALETLANDTLEPGVELMVSEAIRRELLRGGRIRLVGDSATADYVLSGRVESLTSESRSFSSSVRALEFTVSMQLQIAVQGRAGRNLVLDPFALRESEIYLASADIEISAKNRREALRRLSGLLASRIRDALELFAEREPILDLESGGIVEGRPEGHEGE